MLNIDNLLWCRIRIIKNIYDLHVLHNYPPMDNDDPFLEYNDRILNSDGLVGVLFVCIYHNICI